MTRTLKVLAVALSLLAVPVLADAAQRDYFDRGRVREEVRRQVRDAMREARQARFHASRDVRRAIAAERREMRRMADRIRRDVRQATRDLRGRYRWY